MPERLPIRSPVVVRALRVAEERLGLEELSERLRASDALRLVDLLTALEPAWDEADPEV